MAFTMSTSTTIQKRTPIIIIIICIILARTSTNLDVLKVLALFGRSIWKGEK
ncbi:hypothetical protein PVK06_045609 [Gossypium arboreum]|uniref:Uncharacterized protein n=1 Tax=Gossypium arboreum TaxID=29729 RepID=A0ABR0MUJ0_GOSAR|nr:hypothetical protein PVK06_045609 [Gossypium arboreum]